MLAQRNLKLDILALVLLALSVFLTMALFTYDPADPPSRLVHPARLATLNACGQSGAWAAHLLFNALGLGAYYAVLSLSILDGVLLTRRGINAPLLRTAGWLMSLAGVCAFSAMALLNFAPGPAIGAGGYLGAAGRGLLEAHFANLGAYILVFSFIVGGLLLCTDYILLAIAGWILGKPAKQVGGTLVRLMKRRGGIVAGKAEVAGDGGPAVTTLAGKRKRLGTTDLEGGVKPQPAQPEVMPVKRGKKAAEAAKAASETESDESEESVESVASSGGGTALAVAGPVKVKNRGTKVSGFANERQTVIEELDAAESHVEETAEYELPPIELLLESEEFCFEEQEQEVRKKAKQLEETFASFGFAVKVVEIETGPVIAQFEVELEAGLRLAKITSLADDLAIALRVPSVRIVAPIPGKNTVGIEIPNADRQLVRLREVMEEATVKAQKMRIPIFLGSDVSGNPMLVDLTTLPHLLIAGRTGTGKSVCLNTIIMSMLMTRRPDEVRMLFIDPKMVELSPYMKLPHLMHPVVTDMKKAEAILAWAVEKMEERYALLARAGVRHISVYNQLGEEELMERLHPENDEQRKEIPTHLPFIVIVADEMADLMMTSAKEVEHHIIRLAQKSRAVGIHLVLATQKPTVDVITGLIKSNLPARISFQVASRVDSRVVLDEMGADKLLGNGDMLFLWPGTSTLLRGQGAYVSDDEITDVVNFVGKTKQEFVPELVQLKTADAAEGEPGQLANRDELYAAAVDIVIREGRGSVSLLQRSLGIGYGRAARLVDYMAEDGIVGQYNGSQAREVQITAEQWVAMIGAEPDPEPPVKRKPRAKIVPEREEEEEVVAEEEDLFEQDEEPEDFDEAEEDESAGEFDDENEEELEAASLDEDEAA